MNNCRSYAVRLIIYYIPFVDWYKWFDENLSDNNVVVGSDLLAPNLEHVIRYFRLVLSIQIPYGFNSVRFCFSQADVKYGSRLLWILNE